MILQTSSGTLMTSPTAVVDGRLSSLPFAGIESDQSVDGRADQLRIEAALRSGRGLVSRVCVTTTKRENI